MTAFPAARHGSVCTQRSGDTNGGSRHKLGSSRVRPGSRPLFVVAGRAHRRAQSWRESEMCERIAWHPHRAPVSSMLVDVYGLHISRAVSLVLPTDIMLCVCVYCAHCLDCFLQAYSVHLFDGQFVKERVLRDAGLLKSTRKA